MSFPLYSYRATVLDLRDGDTFNASIELGFDIKTEWGVRLIGLDCHETRTKDLEEKALGLKNEAFVQKIIPSGTIVYLTSVKYDKWQNRIDAYVWLDEDKTKCLNQMVIDAGEYKKLT